VSERGRRLLRWAPVVVWMGVIFGFSSLTGSELKTVSAFSVFGHLSEYAVLGALVFLALAPRGTWRRAAFLAVAIASAYGVTDELHQIFTPGRTADPLDWATDTVGAALGIAVVMLVTWAIRTRREGRRSGAR
jgi:VanZ family protein